MTLVENFNIKLIKKIRQTMLVQVAVFLPLLSYSALSMAKTNVAIANTDPTSFYSNFEKHLFTDQNSQTLVFEKLNGKVTLFNFIFTQCSSVCPIQTKELVEIKKMLSPETNKNVRFVSVSLDPLNDTPKVLKTFATKTGANLPGWSFITGSPQSVQHLVDRLQLFGNEKQAKEARRPDGHTTNLWLIDKNGRLIQRYSGNPLDVKRIGQEVGQLYEMP